MNMRGVSLIETLIYIGLFALIMSAAFAALVSITGSVARNQSDAYLEEEGQFLLAKMEEPSARNAPTLVSLTDMEVESFTSSSVEAFGNIPSHTLVTFVLAATSSRGVLREQSFSTTYYANQ